MATEGHKRDFLAYLRWRRLPNGGFCPWTEPLRTRGAADTVEVFAELESRGRTKLAPRFPRVLLAVQEGKRLLNWQIKQWAEGSVYPCCTIPAELREAYPWLPSWVWVALRNQSWSAQRSSRVPSWIWVDHGLSEYPRGAGAPAPTRTS